ncbi:MAG: hypothetical protein ACJA07_000452 [Rhodococcus sp. (in: high G+C Gram-positive bacteria)]|jgi:hypothetical protein
MITKNIADSTITVEHDGNHWQPDDRGNRQRYRYVISTPQWEHIGNDINSGVGAEPDERNALVTLASFLSACAESRNYGGGENSSMFPDHVGEWAQANSDELALLADDGEG